MDRSYGAIVYRTSGNILEFLLVKGGKAGKAKAWGFPKGHAHPGETVEQTIHREVAEETGWSIDLDQDFTTVMGFNRSNGDPKEVILHAATPKEKIPDAKIDDEISEARWVGEREARELFEFPDPAKAMDEFMTYYRNHGK